MTLVEGRQDRKFVCAACGREVVLSVSGELDEHTWPFVARWADMEAIFKEEGQDPILGCVGKCADELIAKKKAA